MWAPFLFFGWAMTPTGSCFLGDQIGLFIFSAVLFPAACVQLWARAFLNWCCLEGAFTTSPTMSHCWRNIVGGLTNPPCLLPLPLTYIACNPVLEGVFRTKLLDNSSLSLPRVFPKLEASCISSVRCAAEEFHHERLSRTWSLSDVISGIPFLWMCTELHPTHCSCFVMDFQPSR